MYVGYLRFKSDSVQTRKLNAIAHSYHGMNLIVFEIKDIDFENKTVTGKCYSEKGWKTKTVPLPKIINNMPFIKANSKAYNFLEQNSKLMFHYFGGKLHVENLLKKNNLLNGLYIPSIDEITEENVLDMLSKHNKILFKPINSTMGRGIFALEKENDELKYIEQKKVRKINKEELLQLIDKTKSNYIAQKYLNSKTEKGLPFDIRVHFEKNGKGKWVRVQTYARVSTNNNLVSNIAKGGSVIRTGLFLKSMYGEEKGDELLQKLKNHLEGFPEAFEKLYDFDIGTIALDLGLDNNNFFLFEINSFPGGTFARGK